MKRILLFIFNISLLLTPLFSIDVKIISFSGKVEIQPSDGIWQSVEVGQRISLQTKVSTGFNSRAVIRIGESELFLQPLTRLTVDELQESSGNIKSAITLRSGRIQSQIKRSTGKMEFTVTTPIATAAVRGTVFELSPGTLRVSEGSVQFLVGDTYVIVPKGAYTRVSSSGPLHPTNTTTTSWSVSPYAGTLSDENGGNYENDGSESVDLGNSSITLN
ncbi:MAG: FecR family protein [Spirochaetaceae bacterium]|jgi:hypothetical protein|nr:FecR family protein [Spirochaetaceae bacterium]